MDDQLDNDLKNRIREVFDEFEDPSADDGWLQLRKKFPEEQSDRRFLAWIWWGSTIAAILLMFLAIGIWLNNRPTAIDKLSYKKPKNVLHEIIAKQKQHDTTSEVPSAKSEGLANSSTNSSYQREFVEPNKKSYKVNKNNEPTLSSKSLLNNSAVGEAFVIVRHSAHIKPSIVNGVIPLTKATQLNSLALTSDTADDKKTAKSAIENNAAKQSIAAVIQPGPSKLSPDTTVSKKKAVKSINDMFAEDQRLNSPKKAAKSDKETKRVQFGVYEATYVNYAKGSSNQVNAGAGFSSEIRISENLKLVTGILVNQNSLSYVGGTPTVLAQNNVAMASAAGPLTYGAAPSSNTGSGAAINAISYFNSVAAIKSYDASLVGLDIPINLKYYFNPQKDNFYVLAGFSSGTFINEAYTYQYNYPSYFPSTLQQTQSGTASKNFNSFYFAKTLNLGLGVGYPLGKNNIVIEPFLKYPLEGLGEQQIRFGSGGINLMFNFSAKK